MLVVTLQQRRQVAAAGEIGSLNRLVVVVLERPVLQPVENLPLELRIVVLGADQRDIAARLQQRCQFVVLVRFGRRHLEQGVAFELFQVGQRGHNGYPLLLCVADHGLRMLFVDRTHDQPGFAELGILQ